MTSLVRQRGTAFANIVVTSGCIISYPIQVAIDMLVPVPIINFSDWTVTTLGSGTSAGLARAGSLSFS
jgi:hypothetical protein